LYTYACFFTHSHVNEQVGWFCNLTIVHSTVITMSMLTFLLTVCKGSVFLASWPTLVCFLDDSFSNSGEMQAYCSFAFLWQLKMVNMFSCIYWPPILLHLKSVCSDPLPIYWLNCLLILCLIFLFVFYIFWKLVL
jgi:hypothetical protein